MVEMVEVGTPRKGAQLRWALTLGGAAASLSWPSIKSGLDGVAQDSGESWEGHSSGRGRVG
jgi:hypothetical protein